MIQAEIAEDSNLLSMVKMGIFTRATYKANQNLPFADCEHHSQD